MYPKARGGRRRSRRSCSAREAPRASGEEVRVRLGGAPTSASALVAASASRSARTRAVRSVWRRSPSGSTCRSSTRSVSLLREAVDADDHTLVGLDLGLMAERRGLDLRLDESLLDRGDGASEVVDPLDQLSRLLLELVRQGLDEVGAAERVGRVRAARLVREDLLRPERDPRGALARQRERLVERVRVDRLRAAAHRRERLDRHAHDVVLGLLGGERRAAGLRVEAKRGRPRVRRPEALAHDLRPQPSCRPELRHLLEEVVVRVEEEGEPLSEGVGRKPRGDRRFAVGDAVRERERELLRGARSRLADVVPGDGDRVPAGQPLLAVGEQIGRQPHRGTRREDVVAPGDVLLQHVVLHRALEAFPSTP